jgi:carbon storage regulator
MMRSLRGIKVSWFFGNEHGGFSMLVLTRKLQESVVVGGAETPLPMLTITVVEIAGGKVRLGFQADPAVHVHRSEVWRKLHGNVQPIAPPSGAGPPGAD